MRTTSFRIFARSAGLLLIVTSVAKLVSAGGSAPILQNTDPIIGISFQKLFWATGACEFAVASNCLFGKRLGLQAGLVAWLAASFLFYRLGLEWVGYHKPCSCLGNVTDALHIPPNTADTIMKIILAYLLIGSYATLFWLWRQKQKAPRPIQRPETSASAI